MYPGMSLEEMEQLLRRQKDIGSGSELGSGWQPISTAPRDGSAVFLATWSEVDEGWMLNIGRWACRTHAMSSVIYCQHDRPDCKPCWYLGMGGFVDTDATRYWMPLPSPPTSAISSAVNEDPVKDQDEKQRVNNDV